MLKILFKVCLIIINMSNEQKLITEDEKEIDLFRLIYLD